MANTCCSQIGVTLLIQQIAVSPELLKVSDFGVTLRDGRTCFKVWSPNTETVRVVIYETWNQYYRREIAMERDSHGCWSVEVPENLEGKYYNYIVSHYGQDVEVVDP